MNVHRIFAVVLLLAAFSTFGVAGTVPEIDPGSASGALVLIGGAALIIRSRRNRK
jgi:hypothetical protein